MQDLGERGYGGLFEPQNAYLPQPVDGEGFSYFASWAWAASKGVPDPHWLAGRCTGSIWAFCPADAYPPPGRIFPLRRGASKDL
jgi:hypothetical protein